MDANTKENDQDCLELIAAGGESRRLGISALYQKYQDKFRRYFLKNRIPNSDAEDLVQDTFVKIVRACESFRRDSDVAVWLWKIARNRMYDHFRVAGRRPTLVDVTGPAPDGSLSPASTAAKEDRLEDCVQGAFRLFALEHAERAETLRLAALEGFTTAELAEVIDRTLGATREYLSQCRKALRPFLDPCQEYLSP